MRAVVLLGTRPELIKGAPVVRGLQDAGVDTVTIGTGQHDGAMRDDHLGALGLTLDEAWTLPATRHRVDELGPRVREVLERIRPDAVVVVGDTDTVRTGALVGADLGIGVVHVEAGLRSLNPRSREERTRRVVAAVAHLHAAPTPLAAQWLLREGVRPDRIAVTGNPIIDVLAGLGLGRVGIEERRGILFSAHRATNVDDSARLEDLVAILRELVRDFGPVVFPIHPRTADRLAAAGVNLERIGVDRRPPLPFDELVRTLRRCRLVVTDSGGLQEEASFFGVPVVVLRRSTPRWESVGAGVAELAGTEVARALAAARRLTAPAAQARAAAAPCPYGDGRAGVAIARFVVEHADCLADSEPDWRDREVPDPTTWTGR